MAACPLPTDAGVRSMSKIFTTSFSSVYPHYVRKVEKKGRTNDELDQVVRWLTGFDEATLRRHLTEETTFEDFFADAHLNPNTSLITGVVSPRARRRTRFCGMTQSKSEHDDRFIG